MSRREPPFVRKARRAEEQRLHPAGWFWTLFLSLFLYGGIGLFLTAMVQSRVFTLSISFAMCGAVMLLAGAYVHRYFTRRDFFDRR